LAGGSEAMGGNVDVPPGVMVGFANRTENPPLMTDSSKRPTIMIGAKRREVTPDLGINGDPLGL